jgi:putative oxidoreductase
LVLDDQVVSDFSGGRAMTNVRESNAAAAPALRYVNVSFATSVAVLLLRLMVGWVFIYTGSQKLFGAFGGIGMETWTHVTAGLGLPVLPAAAWAWLAALSEFCGGVLVLIGLLTRLANIPLIITMIVAIATSTGQNGFGGYFDPAKGLQMGYNLNITLIAISAALILIGPGLVSVDALIFRRGFWSRGAQPLSGPGQRGAST